MCGLPLVGRGFLADLLEDAGYYNIASLRAVSDVQGDVDFIRGIQAAIDRLKAANGSQDHQPDWARIGRKAYRTLIAVRMASQADTDIPEPFKCPLTGDWLEDPVVVPCGISCSRAPLELWLDSCGTCPFTRMNLQKVSLIPNLALRDAINLYRPLEERYLIPRK